MPTNALAWECLEHCPAGIILLDHHLNIRLWNSWLVQASGIPTEKAKDKNLNEVFPSLDNSHLLDAIILALKTGLPSVLTPKLNKFPLPLYRYSADRKKHSFPQSIHVLAIRTNADENRYCLVQINDVSSAFQREEQLRQQAEKLKEQKQKLTHAWQEAKRSNEAKSMFLANMSHEIRTPLNAIIGLSRLSLQDAPEGSVHDDLEKIEQSGKLLLTLINDILDFAKIDAGKMSIEKRCCEIDHVVAQLTDLFRDQAITKQLLLVFELDPNVPLYIETDDLRLQQILINLISNAIKFTEKGEVRIHVRWADNPTRTTTGYLEIQVQDTGMGISETEIERLFQPFSQADETTSRKYGGTGLGLAISKRLIELFGGTIKVTSKKDNGSCFILNLPVNTCAVSKIAAPVQLQRQRICYLDLDQGQKNMLQRALNPWELRAWDANTLSASHTCALLLCPETAVEHLSLEWRQVPRIEFVRTRHDLNRKGQKDILIEPVGAQQIRRKIQRKLQKNISSTKEVSRPKLEKPLQNRTIMVVEDNAINRMIAEKILHRMGASVVSATDGEHALQQINAHTIHAILMDIQMPGMDGYTTCGKLRQPPYSFPGPIIALTAHAMTDEPQRCREAGMDAHVAKPFEPEQLLEILRYHLKENQDELVSSDSSCASEEARSTLKEEMVWHVAQGLKRINNDLELFGFLLNCFLTEFDLKPPAWNDFLAQNPQQQCTWMHNLKSVAANLGATSLAHLAATLEKQLRNSKNTICKAQLQDQLQEFYSALQHYCSLMNTWLKEHTCGENIATRSAPQVAPSTILRNQPQIKESFTQLMELLEKQDLAALDTWKQIRINLEHGQPKFTERLNTCMENLEFKAARCHINHWLAQ